MAAAPRTRVAPRIAINASSIVGPRTGIGRATAELCGALLRRWPEGWPAPLLWINTGRHGRLPQDPWLRSYAGCLRTTRLPGKLLLRGWQHLNLPKIEWLTGPVDVIHAPDSYAPATRAARRVITVHDLYFLLAPEDVDPYGGGYFAETFGEALPRAEAISAVSRFTAEELRIHYPELDPQRIHVVPHGVDTALYHAEPEEADAAVREQLGLTSGAYLLCVATLEPRKNLGRLIEAYARAQARAQGAGAAPLPMLAIAGGKGWAMASIEELAQGAGVGGSVKALGYVDERALPALYRGALGLVFPSLYEGFGLPALEAMACGCPALLARAGSLPEVGGDAADYLDPLETEAMAEALGAFVANEARREQLRTAGALRSRLFTWDAAAEATLDIYRHVAGDPTQAG